MTDMLKSQRELLDTFIGTEGFDFEVIRDHKNFDLGTKILYLERAITQDCHTFLLALDKLYNPDLLDQERAANLEFIRSLKRINDLCFNNEINYGEDKIENTKEALTHYFGRVGDAIVPADFQANIQAIIRDRIDELCSGKEAKVAAQKAASEAAEVDIVRETGWREELDLPMAQQEQRPPPPLDRLNDAQYQQLLSEMKKILVESPHDFSIAYRLMGEFHITCANFRAVDTAEAAALLRSVVVRLMNSVHVSLDGLLALDPEMRAGLLRDPVGVDRLVNIVRIPLAALLELNPTVCAELIKNSLGVDTLVNGARIPIADLLALDSKAHKKILGGNSEAVRALMKDVNISLATLLALDPVVQEALLQNAREVNRLVNEARIPLTNLLAVNPEMLHLLIWRSHVVVRWVTEENISFERLSGLPIPQLRTVLLEPSSEAARVILNPSPPSSSGPQPDRTAAQSSLTAEQYRRFFHELRQMVSDDYVGDGRTLNPPLYSSRVRSSMTEAQYQQLLHEMRQVIDGDLVETHRLTVEFRVRFASFDGIASEPEVAELLDAVVVHLVNEVPISVDNLLVLDPTARAALLLNPIGVDRLVNNVHILLGDLLGLAPAVRGELIRHSVGVDILVNEAHVPLASLLALNPTVLSEILSAGVVVSMRDLVNRVHIPFASLVALDSGVRKELLQNSVSVERLVNDAHVSSTTLVALGLDVLTLLLYRPSAVVQLLNVERIPFERLSGLPVPQLRAVLLDPGSVVAREILNPPPPSSEPRPHM